MNPITKNNDLRGSALISIVLHVMILMSMVVFQLHPQTWTLVPTVYQVELVSPARTPLEVPLETRLPESVIQEEPVEIPQTTPEEQLPAEEPKIEEGSVPVTKKPDIEKKKEPPPKAPPGKETPKPEVKKQPAPDSPKETPTPGEVNAVSDSAKSAISGSNRMKIDIENFPFAYYLNLIRYRIQENWRPPRRTRQMSALVGFEILRNGQIINITIERRSGNFLFDQAAQRAVHYASLLPPLPADFMESKLSVHIEFEGL